MDESHHTVSVEGKRAPPASGAAGLAPLV